ncbi:MAG: hypothetical protein U0457_03645 [Candidatus Sericytochromatia bacterium]
MAIINDCEHISLYLTEYSRGQLSKEETNDIENHIVTCNNCKIENEIFKTMSVETDKLIPTVEKMYEKSLIYRIFIQHREENIFFKGISFILILFMALFIFSGYFEKKIDFVSLGYLKLRAEKIFNQDYYSNVNKEKDEN